MSLEVVALPERVGRYTLVDRLGTGGMASVYLARVEDLPGVERQVALKLLHSKLEADGRGRSGLVEEARVGARIRHPHVVSVLEVGEASAGVYLVLEYVEGVSLSELVRGLAPEKLPLPVVGRILVDALAGLHAAHELTAEDGTPEELVHRDFSPQNLLIGVDGGTKLTDFGIAKTLARLDATTTGVIKGKLRYLAPEQVLGQRLDRRTDVWAAGVVAWELVTGRPLVEHVSERTLLELASVTPPSASSVRGDLPAEIDAVLKDALRLEPSRRIATADELERRIRAAWQSAGGIADVAEVGEFVTRIAGGKLALRRKRVAGAKAPDSTLTPDGAPSARRARWTSPLVLLAIAAVVGSVFLGRWYAARSRVEPSAASPLPAPSAAPVLAMPGSIESVSPSASPPPPPPSAHPSPKTALPRKKKMPGLASAPYGK